MIKSFKSFINEAADDSDKYDFFDHDHDDGVDLETIEKHIQVWIGDNIKRLGKRKIMLVLGDTSEYDVRNINVHPAVSSRLRYVDASRFKNGNIDAKHDYDDDDLTVYCTYNIGGADSQTFKRLMDMFVTKKSGNAHIFVVTKSEYERLFEKNPSLVLRFDGIWKV